MLNAYFTETLKTSFIDLYMLVFLKVNNSVEQKYSSIIFF